MRLIGGGENVIKYQQGVSGGTFFCESNEDANAQRVHVSFAVVRLWWNAGLKLEPARNVQAPSFARV